MSYTTRQANALARICQFAQEEYDRHQKTTGSNLEPRVWGQSVTSHGYVCMGQFVACMYPEYVEGLPQEDMCCIPDDMLPDLVEKEFNSTDYCVVKYPFYGIIAAAQFPALIKGNTRKEGRREFVVLETQDTKGKTLKGVFNVKYVRAGVEAAGSKVALYLGQSDVRYPPRLIICQQFDKGNVDIFHSFVSVVCPVNITPW